MSDDISVTQAEIDEALEDADDRAKALIAKLRTGLSERDKEVKRLKPLEVRVQEIEAINQKTNAATALKEAGIAEPTERQVTAFLRDEATDPKAWVQEMGYSVQAPEVQPPEGQSAAAASTQPPAQTWTPSQQSTAPSQQRISREDVDKMFAEGRFAEAAEYHQKGLIDYHNPDGIKAHLGGDLS